MEEGNLFINNVLCYISCAIDKEMKHDAIIGACVSFYDEQLILDAKNLLYKHTNSRNSRNRTTASMFDEIKDIISKFDHCKTNEIALPKYVAYGIDAMPNESLSFFTKELKNIKETINFMSNEVDVVKSTLLENYIDKSLVCVKDDMVEIKSLISKLKIADRLKSCESDSNITLNDTPLVPESLIFESNDANKLASASEAIPIDFEPSAPPLSQLSEVPDCLITPKTSNDDMRPPYSSKVKVKTLIDSFDKSSPTIKTPGLPKTPRIVVKPSHKQPSRMIKDADGYLTVFSRKKPKNITTGMRSSTLESFRAAEKTYDLYLGRCDRDVTEEIIMNYTKNELGINLLNCEMLNTRIPFSRAFKITVKSDNRDALLDSNSWPERILCRKYFSNNKRS